jgi:hypothetical protein
LHFNHSTKALTPATIGLVSFFKRAEPRMKNNKKVARREHSCHVAKKTKTHKEKFLHFVEFFITNLQRPHRNAF